MARRGRPSAAAVKLGRRDKPAAEEERHQQQAEADVSEQFEELETDVAPR
jgi:hypothetical protein